MMRRLGTVAALSLAAVLILAVGYWAGTNAVVPPSLPAQSPSAVAYQVENGTVSDTARLPIMVEWHSTGTLYSGTAGVVTSILKTPGDYARSGEVVATVDLQPVIVASGTVPMFRTLQKDVSGPDVAQFQQMLTAGGFYTGSGQGTFDSATIEATKRWQASLRISKSGQVPLGTLLFLAELPARLEVVPGVGETVQPGTPLLKVYASKPSFSSMLNAIEIGGLSTGARVAIDGPGGQTWAGEIAAIHPADSSLYSVEIGGTLCGDDCDALPVGAQTSLNGHVDIVPAVSGPVVPTSALTTEPSGALSVRLPDGSTRSVEIVAQANGFAVVKGIEAGTTILLPPADR